MCQKRKRFKLALQTSFSAFKIAALHFDVAIPTTGNFKIVLLYAVIITYTDIHIFSIMAQLFFLNFNKKNFMQYLTEIDNGQNLATF